MRRSLVADTRTIEIARRHVDCLTAVYFRHEYMVADVLAPLVPVAIQQSREVVDFDGVFLGLFISTFVARLVRALGVHVGNHGNA